MTETYRRPKIESLRVDTDVTTGHRPESVATTDKAVITPDEMIEPDLETDAELGTEKTGTGDMIETADPGTMRESTEVSGTIPQM